MTSMDLITFDQLDATSQEMLAIDPASLYQAFEQVKDGRGKKGKRYPLAFILTLIMLGKLAGQTTIDGIITWIDARKYKLKKILNWPKSFPSRKAYDGALSNCDSEEVVKIIAQVILKARAAKQGINALDRLPQEKEQSEKNLIHTAMDGKVMKGTLKHENENQPEVRLVSFYEVESGIVIEQKAYENQGDERTVGFAILHPSLVKGRIITTDALHSYRKFCTTIHVDGGFYMTIIKDNNPAVRKDLEAFFHDEGINRSEWQYYKNIQKAHGRLEIREIWTSRQMNGYFKEDWTGIAQVFMIRRHVIEKGKERTEIVYGITNLPRKKADAEYLLELNRKHWCIENRLHYRRDVTLGEDAGQVRIKGAPQVIAALNGGVLAIADLLGIKNLAKQMIYYCAEPQKILQLLLGNLSMQNG